MWLRDMLSAIHDYPWAFLMLCLGIWIITPPLPCLWARGTHSVPEPAGKPETVIPPIS